MAMIKRTFKMEDLDCANCAGKMQEAIAKLDGVGGCEISFMTQKMTLEYEESDSAKIFKAIKKCIKKVEPDCTVYFD